MVTLLSRRIAMEVGGSLASAFPAEAVVTLLAWGGAPSLNHYSCLTTRGVMDCAEQADSRSAPFHENVPGAVPGWAEGGQCGIRAKAADCR